MICTTFSKAGVESLAGAVIFFWLIKRLFILKFKVWQLRKFFPSTLLNLPLVVYVLIIVLSTINSVDYRVSIVAFFGKTTEYLLLYFAITDTVNTKRRVYVFIGGLIVSTVGLIIDSGFQYVTGIDLFRHFMMNDDLRLKASFGNANDLAGWLILIIPVLASFVFFLKKQKMAITLILWLTTFFAVICLILTFSKAALIGFILSCIIFMGIIRKNLRNYVIFLLIVVIIGYLSFLKRGYSLDLSKINTSISVLVRIDLWKRAMAMIADYPILGSGPSTYTEVIGRYGSGWQPNTAYPHNSFLHIAAETGITGLLTFLWIIFVLAKEVIKNLRKNRDNPELIGFSLGIFAFLFQSFFDTNLSALQLVIPFWIFLALTVNLASLKQLN